MVRRIFLTFICSAAVMGCGASGPGGGASGGDSGAGGTPGGSNGCHVKVTASLGTQVMSSDSDCQTINGQPAGTYVVATETTPASATPNIGELAFQAAAGAFVDLFFLGPPASATWTSELDMSPNLLPISMENSPSSFLPYPRIRCAGSTTTNASWGSQQGTGNPVQGGGTDFGKEVLMPFTLTVSSLEVLDMSHTMYTTYIAHGTLHVDCKYAGGYSGVVSGTVTLDATF